MESVEAKVGRLILALKVLEAERGRIMPFVDAGRLHSICGYNKSTELLQQGWVWMISSAGSALTRLI